MLGSESRIAAIKSLLDDEVLRENRDAWRAIFDNAALLPPINDPFFAHELLQLLQNEVDYGRRKENEIRKVKSRRAAKYIRSQMRVSPAIGRYIYAVLGWHNSSSGHSDHETLVSVSQALNFDLDPQEMQLQQLSQTERKEVILEAKNREWDAEIRAAALLAIAGFAFFVWKLISRSTLF